LIDISEFPRIRPATDEDAGGVVELYKKAWTGRQVWTAEKWRSYYAQYPEGLPCILVAEDYTGALVGHLSLLPTRLSTGHKVMMQSHVIVDPNYRDGSVLDKMLDAAKDWASQHEVELIIAYTAYRFSRVLQRLYGWKTIGHLSFVNCAEIDSAHYADRIRFVYGDDWYGWRFGSLDDAYVFDYEHARVQNKQLWKTRTATHISAAALGAAALNCWHPDHYTQEKPPEWSVSLMVFPLVDVDSKTFNINNWYIEIGDSDIHRHSFVE
jgi:L-amino acid N-acyltransferase YncA